MTSIFSTSFSASFVPLGTPTPLFQTDIKPIDDAAAFMPPMPVATGFPLPSFSFLSIVRRFVSTPLPKTTKNEQKKKQDVSPTLKKFGSYSFEDQLELFDLMARHDVRLPPQRFSTNGFFLRQFFYKRLMRQPSVASDPIFATYRDRPDHGKEFFVKTAIDILLDETIPERHPLPSSILQWLTDVFIEERTTEKIRTQILDALGTCADLKKLADILQRHDKWKWVPSSPLAFRRAVKKSTACRQLKESDKTELAWRLYEKSLAIKERWGKYPGDFLQALGLLRCRHPLFLNFLIDLCKEKNGYASLALSEGYGEMALPLLCETLEEEIQRTATLPRGQLIDNLVKWFAGLTLKFSRLPGFLTKHLIKQDPLPPVAELLEVLANIGYGAKPALPLLETFYKTHPDPFVRMLAFAYYWSIRKAEPPPPTAEEDGYEHKLHLRSIG